MNAPYVLHVNITPSAHTYWVCRADSLQNQFRLTLLTIREVMSASYTEQADTRTKVKQK